MRVGKKPNVVEVKKTRSCVVRLEKVSTTSPNVSPSPEENRSALRTNRLGAMGMGATSKGRRGGITSQQEERSVSGTAKKKIVESNNSIHSNYQTLHQPKGGNSNMSNIRSNQKDKVIPRLNKTSSTSSREETPPPTIAAGRTRRAIKPNPKYASEDIVTPKVVRNVGMLASSGSRGGTVGQNRARKASTSSDDFYNRNSDDDYENDVTMTNDDDDNYEELENDKAYHASEKDDHDSDFSVTEEPPSRTSRTRARQKKVQESTQAITQQNDKLQSESPNMKRAAPSVTPNSSNLRSAPSQLQQIRRSLASANAQRNLNLLVGSGGPAQKRKLDEIQDPSENSSSYSIKRKQLLNSNSSDLKAKLPVRENIINVTSITKGRLITQPQIYKAEYPQTVNGSNKISSALSTSRRPNEFAAKSNSESAAKSSMRQSGININPNNKTHSQNPLTTQTKIVASKVNRIRSDSPKPLLQKERQRNGALIPLSSSSTSSTNCKPTANSKTLGSQSTLKSKSATPTHNSIAINSEIVHEIKDDSPNSTIDDFETMPTFTIVNVNDIINKKGDVLITKANSNKTPTVIELSESISIDDDDDDNNDDIGQVQALIPTLTRPKQILSKKMPNLPNLNTRKENDCKSTPIRSNESSRKLSMQPPTSARSLKQAPQILNHKLGLRNSRVAAKTTTTLTTTLTSSDKPAPRILNSVVAKRTQPVKPMIANMDDSADESFPLSLDDDEEEEETEDEIESPRKMGRISEKGKNREYQNLMEVDTEDTESQNTEENDVVLQTINAGSTNVSSSKLVALAPSQNTGPQRRRRTAAISNNPNIVSSNQKRLTPAAKENSLAATNQQVTDANAKQTISSTIPARKANTEKIVISKQGDKIIKKITCFETWYVINMPVEPKRPAAMKNQLEMPLIRLANNVKNICLPNDMWSSKVTLYELSPQTLAKATFATYTGDIYEHNIREEDRGKYQPSCVMFRRSMAKNLPSRMPYDRAVIFKNKTFYTNIEGKNVRLVGAPSIINSESEVEILLEVVDSLNLESDFIEHISILQ